MCASHKKTPTNMSRILLKELCCHYYWDFISWDKIWSVHVDEARSMVVRLELRERQWNWVGEKQWRRKREEIKRDYGGERDLDFFFFFLGLEINMECTK